MTSAALHARENASTPPRESHGRLVFIGKTGISITASSISSHSLTAVLVRLTTGHSSVAPRPTPHAVGRELGLVSCSIPPWFVLSNNLSTTNTRAIWLCLSTFLSPPASSVQFHWLLATDHHSPVPPSSPGPAVSGRPQTLPHWLLPDTDRRFVKDRTGSNLDERPSYIEYVTEPGDSCGKIKPCFPTRRRRTLDHSLVARGAQRQSLQACLPDGHQPQCRFSPRFPDFAQAVWYSVPGTPSSPKQLGTMSPEL